MKTSVDKAARVLLAQSTSTIDLLRHPDLGDDATLRAVCSMLPNRRLAHLLESQLKLDSSAGLATNRRQLAAQEARQFACISIDGLSPRARVDPGPELNWSFQTPAGEDWMLRRGRLKRRALSIHAQDLIEKGDEALGRDTPPLVIEGLFERAVVEPTRITTLEKLYGGREWAPPLAQCNALSRVSHLALRSQYLGNTHLAMLLSSEHLTRLRTLVLAIHKAGVEALEVLSAPERFPVLARLKLTELDDQDGHSSVGDHLVNILEARRADTLVTLEVPFTSLSADAVGRLMNSPTLSNLRCLDVSNTELGPSMVDAVPPDLNLTRLDLSGCGLDFGGLQALLSDGRLSRLHALSIGGPQRLDTAELTPGSHRLPTLKMPTLQHLDLSDTDIGDYGIEALVNSTLPTLRSLNIARCKVTPDGLDRLVASPLFQQLEVLNLSDNPIHDKGLEILAASRGSSLHGLSLARANLTSPAFSVNAVRRFLRSRLFKSLNWADLEWILDPYGPISDTDLLLEALQGDPGNLLMVMGVNPQAGRAGQSLSGSDTRLPLMCWGLHDPEGNGSVDQEHLFEQKWAFPP